MWPTYFIISILHTKKHLLNISTVILPMCVNCCTFLRVTLDKITNWRHLRMLLRNVCETVTCFILWKWQKYNVKCHWMLNVKEFFLQWFVWWYFLTSVNSNVKVKVGHTPKERRRGAHLLSIGRWARRWINHYCLWRMASAMPDLRLPSQPKLVLIAPTHRGMARLSWPRWLVT